MYTHKINHQELGLNLPPGSELVMSVVDIEESHPQVAFEVRQDDTTIARATTMTQALARAYRRATLSSELWRGASKSWEDRAKHKADMIGQRLDDMDERISRAERGVEERVNTLEREREDLLHALRPFARRWHRVNAPSDGWEDYYRAYRLVFDMLPYEEALGLVSGGER